MRYATYNEFGAITGVISTSDTYADENPLLPLIRITDPFAEVSHLSHYVDLVTKTLVPIPTPRPSEYHFYNPASGEWEANMALAEGVVKTTRKRYLAESDWTQLPDVPLETKEAWATYRQALRDITNQPGYPLEITWPVPVQG